MDNPITRAEHEEFRRRLEEENRRQDKRIELLENNMRELNQLTASVGKLATSVESMVKEQEKQGKRLETLEDRDGAMWRKVVAYGATAVIGIVIGYIARQIGLN
ncbi:hypothetical protein [Butyricicoccus sp. AM78-15b2TA]|uniref:hypothetical protein n=1 Tax=Butyricicoccus sp. AM78-15b2TA TaxID=3002516 RepID=UPI0022E3A14F|nr:hypothetical protein [Butyricicoccus sp. AM78-15b2TA]